MIIKDNQPQEEEVHCGQKSQGKFHRGGGVWACSRRYGLTETEGRDATHLGGISCSLDPGFPLNLQALSWIVSLVSLQPPLSICNGNNFLHGDKPLWNLGEVWQRGVLEECCGHEGRELVKYSDCPVPPSPQP